MTFDTSITATPGTPPSSAEIDAARKISEIEPSTLPNMRAAAEKWRNGIAFGGVIGGAIAIIGGPGALSGLTAARTEFVAGAAAVAVIAGFVSIALAMRASFGWPVHVDASSLAELANWKAKETTATKRALMWSLMLTLVSLIGFVVSVSAVLFGPVGPPVEIITTTTGQTLCVDSVVRVGSSLEWIKGDEKVKLDLRSIAALETANSCPSHT